MSQESFAERLGISRGRISQMERGASPPSNQLVQSICREFGVSREWLLTGAGDSLCMKGGHDHREMMELFSQLFDVFRKAEVLPKSAVSDDEIRIIKALRLLPGMEAARLLKELESAVEKESGPHPAGASALEGIREIAANGVYEKGVDLESVLDALGREKETLMGGEPPPGGLQ